MSESDTETPSEHESETSYMTNRRTRQSVLRKYGEKADADMSNETERKLGPEDFTRSC